MCLQVVAMKAVQDINDGIPQNISHIIRVFKKKKLSRALPNFMTDIFFLFAKVLILSGAKTRIYVVIPYIQYISYTG